MVQQGPADVIIGKHGVSEALVAEIRRRLEDKGVVKVKALRTAVKVTGLDRRSLARLVAERTGAWLLDVRGRTFVLYLPPGRRVGGRGSGSGGQAGLGGAGGGAVEPRGRGNIRPRWPRARSGERKPWSRR
jgi:RNA-binding protein